MNERILYYNTCDFYAENTYSKVLTKSEVLLIHSSFVMTCLMYCCEMEVILERKLAMFAYYYVIRESYIDKLQSKST